MSTLTSAIDPRRRTEADPDYQRIQAQTEKRLHAALARLCNDLRTGRVQATAAQSVFIHTATSILEAAYTEAHAEGQRDYWQRVSQVPHEQPIVAPDEGKMRQRLAFYAPSVAKMAHEALLAHQAALAGRTLAAAVPERTGVIRLTGGHEAGYEQNRDAHGRSAPGDGGEGDRGEVKRLGPGYNPYRDSHGRFAPGPHAPRESETSGGNGRPGASRSEGRDTARHAGGGGRASQRGGAPKTEEEKAAARKEAARKAATTRKANREQRAQEQRQQPAQHQGVQTDAQQREQGESHPERFINEDEVKAWTRGNAREVPKIGYHYTSEAGEAALRAEGVDVARAVHGGYGQGFHMLARADRRAPYGNREVRVALRMRHPLVIDGLRYADLRHAIKAAHPQARGTDAHGRDRSDEVVRQELLRRGYDGVIVKDWQSPARTQLVLGIAPETMRVI